MNDCRGDLTDAYERKLELLEREEELIKEEREAQKADDMVAQLPVTAGLTTAREMTAAAAAAAVVNEAAASSIADVLEGESVEERAAKAATKKQERMQKVIRCETIENKDWMGKNFRIRQPFVLIVECAPLCYFSAFSLLFWVSSTPGWQSLTYIPPPPPPPPSFSNWFYSCSALAALASTSGVSSEREAFMDLVEKEIGRLNDQLSTRGVGMVFTRGQLGVERQGAVEEALGQQRLADRVAGILQRVEKELDAADSQIGSRLRVLDQDNDGVVSNCTVVVFFFLCILSTRMGVLCDVLIATVRCLRSSFFTKPIHTLQHHPKSPKPNLYPEHINTCRSPQRSSPQLWASSGNNWARTTSEPCWRPSPPRQAVMVG
jgi:hypothetical protein